MIKEFYEFNLYPQSGGWVFSSIFSTSAWLCKDTWPKEVLLRNGTRHGTFSAESMMLGNGKKIVALALNKIS
jgi:hypothetical protein